VFAPITLWNHGQDCPKGFPREVGQAALARTGDKTREQQRLLDLTRYLDVAAHPYLHLVDGGVADNLALRGVVEMEDMAKVVRPDVGVPWLSHVRKGLFIVVDAGTESAEHVELSANVPRVGEVAAALADIPIQRYSDETRYLFQQTVARWRQGAVDAGVARQDMPVYLAEVSLQAVRDARLRKRLRGLPTTLYLPQSVTRELREAGAQMLRDSPDFQRLLKSLDGARRADPRP
jgi:NTE family protein